MRGSIHRVDPVSTAVRRSVAIRRRTYWVRGPNAVWHIDGHHKLIRWRFVTHGGIDGYSRTITYLKCSTNNKASTVVAGFCDAVSKYGLPECIRSDLGGENIEVWRYMIQEHSSHSAVVTGSSTHNERIERLWRDVCRCVGVIFHNLFRTMEDEGRLDCLNEVDLYCLHYTFLPRINHTLNSFVESWNNHPLSTCGNLTPNQLFVQGALQQNITPTVPPAQSTSSTSIMPTAGDTVGVPRSSFSPCNSLQQELDQVNVQRFCDDQGYSQVCDLVGRHLQNCSLCQCNWFI